MSIPVEVTLSGTHYHDLLPSGGGSPYRLLLAPPLEPSPPQGFPVLYLLDGGAFFGTLVEMVRMRRNRPAMTGVAAAMVVGIAHPGFHPYDRDRRRLDYMPGKSRDEGLLNAFQRFLLEDVHPFIESHFPVDPGHRVLLGHSLAGYFVLDTLLQAPRSHRGYVAVSPSIWMDRERLESGLSSVGERIKGGDPPPSLMVGVGEYDQAIAPWQTMAPEQEAFRKKREERGMVDEAHAFAGRFAEAIEAPERVHLEVYSGEDHSSVVPIALSHSLRVMIPLGVSTHP